LINEFPWWRPAFATTAAIVQHGVLEQGLFSKSMDFSQKEAHGLQQRRTRKCVTREARVAEDLMALIFKSIQTEGIAQLS
jgi:hypothetical protein